MIMMEKIWGKLKTCYLDYKKKEETTEDDI